jgi:predicted AAA+ superfamily ATPase
MPHDRPRYLAPLITRALAHSPIVGVMGQRQVGKTTLLQAASAEYLSFDRASALAQARADAELFLAGRKTPFGIDEAQLCPELFPALKELVRVHRKKGQYLLSGSVRFTSRASIRESLTGRIVSLELLPFTMAEASQLALPSVCASLLCARSAKTLEALASPVKTSQAFARYLECGGLPGICFFRDAHVREQHFEAHLDTLLNRDLRQVSATTLGYGPLRALLAHLADQQGRPFVLGNAARASQISVVTLKKILYAMEALFLIRTVTALGQHKSTIFLEDQGLATWLRGHAPISADDIVRGLYVNLRQEFHYRPELRGKVFQFRTHNGVEVPLAFSSRLGTLGIVPTTSRDPAAKTLGSAQSFLRRFPGSKVVVAYAGSRVVIKTPAMYWVPYWLLV